MNWHFCIDNAEKRALDFCNGSMDDDTGAGGGYYTGYSWGNGDGSGNGYDLGLGDGPREAVTYPMRDVSQAQAANWWKSAKRWI
jgi:hypothetical protein